jgi:DNA polymerase-1
VLSTNRLITIDFETYDPTLDTLGSGWVFGTLLVIGASIRLPEWQHAKWVEKKEDILHLIEDADGLIGHNIAYDVGILKMWGVNLRKYTLIDTMWLAKMHDSTRMSYSLDSLTNASKCKDSLGTIVLKHKLYKTSTGKAQNISDIKKANKYAITHMHEMYQYEPGLVIKYANQDVNLTWALYEKYSQLGIDWKWVDKLSQLQNILLDQRQRGVRIDLERLVEVQGVIRKREQELYSEFKRYTDQEDFNPLSSKHVAALLYDLNIPFPLTPKGNPSVKSSWLGTQNHPVCKLIVEYRKYVKYRRDFCDTVLEAQQLMPEAMRGRVYPEFRVLGAAATGRLSCAKPNIQQIPSRDDNARELIRSIYVAEIGEKWYSLDFSQQEYRIFAHFADKVLGGSSLANEYSVNKDADVHDHVANMTGLDRKYAKGINFGSLYCIGKDLLAYQLDVTTQQATDFLTTYHKKFGDVQQVMKACSNTIKNYKYITTVGGRKLRLDKPAMVDKLIGYEQKEVNGKIYKVPKYQKKLMTFEYKGISKLIQGSAADQTMEAIIEIDKQGLPMLFSVHDEVNLSSANRDDALKIQSIMENVMKFNVPMYSDIGEGDNWAQAK